MSFKIFSRRALSLLASCFILIISSPNTLAAAKGTSKQDKQGKNVKSARPEHRHGSNPIRSARPGTSSRRSSAKASPSVDFPLAEMSDPGPAYGFMDFTDGILDDGP